MNTRFLAVLIPSAIALALSACGGRGLESPGPGPEPRSCTDQGKVHASGTSWTCSDGCNTCSCEDGAVASTLIACQPPPPSCTVLAADGGLTTYPSGQSWPGACGGQCTCNAGLAECPEELCVEPCMENGVAHSPGSTWSCFDGCDVCTCGGNGQYSVVERCDDGGGPRPAPDGGVDGGDSGDAGDSAVPGQCGPTQHLCACSGGSYCLAGNAACLAPTAMCPCTTADDCVGALPAVCAICDDGGYGCAHFACNGGACQTAFCE